MSLAIYGKLSITFLNYSAVEGTGRCGKEARAGGGLSIAQGLVVFRSTGSGARAGAGGKRWRTGAGELVLSPTLISTTFLTTAPSVEVWEGRLWVRRGHKLVAHNKRVAWRETVASALPPPVTWILSRSRCVAPLRLRLQCREVLCCCNSPSRPEKTDGS